MQDQKNEKKPGETDCYDTRGAELEKLKVRYAELEREYAGKTALLNSREESARKEARQLRERIAALEGEVVLVKEKHLKADAQKDAEWSKKRESLLAEMEAKERELEEGWTRRHKTLEAGQKEYHAEFEKRHLALLEELRVKSAWLDKLYAQKEAKLMELHTRLVDGFQDREAKARAVEEELRSQVSMVAASAADLAREYELKVSELEEVKRKILAEIYD